MRYSQLILAAGLCTVSVTPVAAAPSGHIGVGLGHLDMGSPHESGWVAAVSVGAEVGISERASVEGTLTAIGLDTKHRTVLLPGGGGVRELERGRGAGAGVSGLYSLGGGTVDIAGRLGAAYWRRMPSSEFSDSSGVGVVSGIRVRPTAPGARWRVDINHVGSLKATTATVGIEFGR